MENKQKYLGVEIDVTVFENGILTDVISTSEVGFLPPDENDIDNGSWI